MKVYVYRDGIGLANLKPSEWPDPVPGPEEIVLRMRAAALNYRDLAIARGHYHVDVRAPLVPVSDGAGEVVEVGHRVTRFAVGDLACPTYMPDWIDGPIGARVARRRLGGPTDGVLREYLCLDQAQAVRAPAGMSVEEAATLPVAAVTAWHSLYELGRIRPGESVLVQGTGGVSTAAVQLALAGGARVIAGTRGDRHAAGLRALGVDEVVTLDDGIGDRVRTLTDGGVDVAVNVAGGATLHDSITATRPGGIVHLVGYAAGTSAAFDIFDAIRHATTILTASAGSRQSFENTVRAIERNRIRPVVSRCYPVSDWPDAFEELAAGGHLGKIVLTF